MCTDCFIPASNAIGVLGHVIKRRGLYSKLWLRTATLNNTLEDSGVETLSNSALNLIFFSYNEVVETSFDVISGVLYISNTFPKTHAANAICLVMSILKVLEREVK